MQSVDINQRKRAVFLFNQSGASRKLPVACFPWLLAVAGFPELSVQVAWFCFEFRLVRYLRSL